MRKANRICIFLYGSLCLILLSVLSVELYRDNMVEETPDTVITLTTGKKIIVKESRQEVKNLVKLYERDLFTNT